jgi:hypothetical protein
VRRRRSRRRRRRWLSTFCQVKNTVKNTYVVKLVFFILASTTVLEDTMMLYLFTIL